jgi:hypothetical protein
LPSSFHHRVVIQTTSLRRKRFVGSARVYRFVLRLTNGSLAEDLVSEVFIEVWLHRTGAADIRKSVRMHDPGFAPSWPLSPQIPSPSFNGLAVSRSDVIK